MHSYIKFKTKIISKKYFFENWKKIVHFLNIIIFFTVFKKFIPIKNCFISF